MSKIDALMEHPTRTTLSATQITMYAVETIKILLGEFNGHPSMILTAATLAMPQSLQTYANLIAVTRNVETRL